MMEKMEKIDFWSKILDRALDILFAKYPARTGLGVIFGITLSVFTQLFAPALKDVTFLDFAAVPWWGWMFIGMLTMHLPTIVANFNLRSIGNDAIDQSIELIERGKFSPTERRQQYRLLIERAARSTALSQETRREVNNVEDTLVGSRRKSQK